ncbi:MAG: response regulator [Deltaproteobacteria bacterium]|nr:response regulator [Deltaproteobacteria bacterium]
MNIPTILFVDDETNILRALRRLFIDEDYDVQTATSGKEALEMITGGLQPTVIVSDQRMPAMGGAEFLARTREIVPDSVRMVLTGYADINAAVRAINQGGIYRYILKPWNDDDLKLAVHGALQSYNLVQENRQLTEELTEKNRELGQLNAQLEKKVEERTLELRRRVQELQGRDHVQQYLLAVHPLSELLHTILEVVMDVVRADGAAFYLVDKVGCAPQQRAAINFAEAAPGGADSPLAAAMLKAGESDDQDGGLIDVAGRNYTIVPVHKGKRRMGTMMVRAGQGRRFDEHDLHTIAGFGRQAAIGINDSRLQENFEDIEISLDDVLAAL